MILNSKVFTKIFEKCIVKLSSVVKHQYSGPPKPAHDVFPDEVLYILLRDACQGFYFYPLSEIVYPYHQELHLEKHRVQFWGALSIGLQQQMTI